MRLLVTGTAMLYAKVPGWHEISMIYYITIYRDSIMIFSSENIMILNIYFQNVNLCYYYCYLLTFLIHAYLTQTAQVPKLLDGAKN